MPSGIATAIIGRSRMPETVENPMRCAIELRAIACASIAPSAVAITAEITATARLLSTALRSSLTANTLMK